MKLVYPHTQLLDDPNLSRTQEIMRQFAVARAKAIESVLLDAATAHRVEHGRFPLFVLVDEIRVDHLKWELVARASDDTLVTRYSDDRRKVQAFSNGYLNAVGVSE